MPVGSGGQLWAGPGLATLTRASAEVVEVLENLEVVGADSGIVISSAIANRPHLRLVNGTTNVLQLSVNAAYGAIGDGTDANRYMSFKGGSVGIGTVAPAKILDVNGPARATNSTSGGKSYYYMGAVKPLET